MSSTSSYLPLVNNVLYAISGMRSRIDQVFRDPMIWNSEGPFLLATGVGDDVLFAREVIRTWYDRLSGPSPTNQGRP